MRHESRFPRVVVAALALFAAGVADAADLPRAPITFSGSVEAINLNVTAMDGRNHYVSTLAGRDFTILEDGVPQELAVFAQESVPISLTVLVDTSASMQAKLPDAQAAALRLLETALKPGDRASIVAFNQHVTTVQDFTSDPAALRAAVGALQVSGSTALYTAVYVTLKGLVREGATGEARRRALVLLSDGEDTVSRLSDDDVLKLARASNVAVYAVSLAGDPAAAPPDRVNGGLPTYFMTNLAKDTGGQAFFPRSSADLAPLYAGIGQELRSQYAIGYVSTNGARDGRWRRITILTPNQANLRLRHRAGYYAPRR